MDGTPITFDANSLQTSDILTATIDHESIPVKNAQIFNIANANAGVIPYISYTQKVITISGKVMKSTIPDLDNFLDTFRGYFRFQDRFLDIGYGSGTRRYIATATGVQVQRPGGLLHANFTVTFTCTQPFGQDILPTTLLSATGRTSSSYTDIITVQGSAPVQLPILTLTYTAISGGTAKTIIFGNNATGQQLRLTSTFVAGDVVTFNTVDRTVTQNGTLKDFTGAFPEFESGAQQAFYSDNFTTSRTFNYNLSYYRQWM